MTKKEQYESCEICKHHNIVNANGGFRFMACHYGEYKNHPVWGDFKCPLGEKKPIRKMENNNELSCL